MRGDYVDKFQHQWAGGLHRLLADGAWFRQVDYPYFDTVTCPGHTTIATGTLPSVHGMVLNVWWDPRRKAEVRCTFDETTSFVSYGRSVAGAGDSAANIRVATLADALRAQTSPSRRVIAFSLKARAAIALAGHKPAAVTWFDDTGTWVTSTAFANAPVPEVADFIRRHPVEADFDKTWDRALKPSAYLYDPVALGATPGAHAPSFPHSLKGRSQAPDAAFYERWQTSPLSDDYLAQMALDVARHLHFDRDGATNMIGISFSALDRVGHAFGPESHEVQDTLVRLDRTLGVLFAGLDGLVGAGNYTVALTADHGVAPVPEQMRARGLDAGRMTPAQFGAQLETVFQRMLGPGRYVAHVASTHVYLYPDVFERMKREGKVPAVRAAIRALPFVAGVYTRDQIEKAPLDDSNLGRIARSYDPTHSGDLVVVLRQYWLTYASVTTHGSAYGYDARVPMLLMGYGIRPGQYLAPASPLDLAPTLAFLAGVTLPRAEGRVLSEGLTPSRAAAIHSITQNR